jgi:preprotein translocase subunit SecF
MNDMKKKIYLFSFSVLLILVSILLIFFVNRKQFIDDGIVKNSSGSLKQNENRGSINNNDINQKVYNKKKKELKDFLEKVDYDEFIKKYKELKSYEEKVSLVKKFFSQEKILKEVEEKYHNFTPEDKARNKSLYILTGVKNKGVSDEKEYLLYGALASVLLDGLDIVKIDTL